MSRIGKQPIKIPADINVEILGNVVKVMGSKGTLKRLLHDEIHAEFRDHMLYVTPSFQTKRTAALWGLERALLANIVHGVANGYEKRLELEGVGYRVQLVNDKELALALGFSHPVTVIAPEGITFKTEKNVIIVSGIDKALVGQVAANIRAKKPPEPYKGKGIHYMGEVIRRKAGKKATAAAK
ncbi:MAG: 50S ribosomal protein L6 [bacterium]|nr:50S ribosomal protein L6 [bacterium]